MRILLVSPSFPRTYWGFQYSLHYAEKRVALPPLGLITLAALLPQSWQLRLVDLNASTLEDDDVLWSDAVLVGGMRVQSESMHRVLARARELGRRSVVGGPAPTTAPDDWPDADIVFRGEAEGRMDALAQLLAGAVDGRVVLAAPEQRPDITKTPVPRYDLLDLSVYASMSLQYSRGCPFRCEFCDIIEIFGRKSRVKTSFQVLTEMSALHFLGYRGSLFIVDDNFIGNKPAVKQLLPRIERWQRERGRPFEIYTEASINLAADVPLTKAMVAAGFNAVFVGIESPSKQVLAAINKTQNLRVELRDAIAALTHAGLEVMGGFIVGFDQDDSDVFDAQLDLIAGSPIPFAMIGLLTALPGTALTRRLSREGRLRTSASGDQFGRPNFEPAMDEVELLSGYAKLMQRVYAPDEYYRRCRAFVSQAGAGPARKASRSNLATFARAVFGIGLMSPRRRQFWSLLGYTLWHAPKKLSWAVAHAVMGEHMILYTHEDVLPRIRRAIAEVERSRLIAADLTPIKSLAKASMHPE